MTDGLVQVLHRSDRHHVKCYLTCAQSYSLPGLRCSAKVGLGAPLACPHPDVYMLRVILRCMHKLTTCSRCLAWLLSCLSLRCMLHRGWQRSSSGVCLFMLRTKWLVSTLTAMSISLTSWIIFVHYQEDHVLDAIQCNICLDGHA